MGQFVRCASKMNDGTEIQLEDWSDTHKNNPELWWAVGAYPAAKRGSGRPFGPNRRGEKFRLTISFPGVEEAMEAFQKLSDGEAELLDYADKFWNQEKDAELLREV